MELSKGFLSSLKPKSTIYNVYIDNLLVIVRPSGRITFYVYTTAGGTRKKYKIGSFPDNRLDDSQIAVVSKEYRRIWFNIHLPKGMRPDDLERRDTEAFKKDLRKFELSKLKTVGWVFGLAGPGQGEGLRRESLALGGEQLADIDFQALGQLREAVIGESHAAPFDLGNGRCREARAFRHLDQGPAAFLANLPQPFAQRDTVDTASGPGFAGRFCDSPGCFGH